MARAKISEYRAKNIIFKALGSEYQGLSINTATINESEIIAFAESQQSVVVKVDQAIKKRNKLGLVFIGITAENILETITKLKDLGYAWLLVEPLVAHDEAEERFIALERTVNGVEITQSLVGGVKVEEAPQNLQKIISVEPHEPEVLNGLEDSKFITMLLKCFEDNHFTYLEINPYIVQGDQFAVLDAAVEVDTSAEFFVNNNWSAQDIRTHKTVINEAEKAVDALGEKSPASLTLKVLNENGSIFLLLSGGGASVVIADEFSSLGYHEQMANYGEYSGNPNEEETYLYTKQVLQLLLKSTANKKVLLIAGGTANFTDIAVTFKGIIHALEDDAAELKAQNVAVFVRRGGPNQIQGLQGMRDYLNDAGLVNEVYGPEESLGSVVAKVVKSLEV